jgi:hypothetical protein
MSALFDSGTRLLVDLSQLLDTKPINFLLK